MYGTNMHFTTREAAWDYLEACAREGQYCSVPMEITAGTWSVRCPTADEMRIELQRELDCCG